MNIRRAMRYLLTLAVVTLLWAQRHSPGLSPEVRKWAERYTHRSGTPMMMHRLSEKYPALKAAWRADEERIRALAGSGLRTAAPGCEQPIAYVPVVVHIVHGGGFFSPQIGEEVDSIPAQRVRAVIEQVNDDFRRRPYTRAAGTGVDTRIEIALATRDPNGNPHSGVDYINFRNYGLDSSYVSGDSLFDPGSNLFNLIVSNAWPHDRYLNLWVFDALEGAEGFALIPLPPPTILPPVYHPLYLLDGAYLAKYIFFAANDDIGRVTVTHELGHNFGLYHPFSDPFGSALDCRGVQNATCASEGDKVCDTPPTIGFDFVPVRANTCPENISALAGDRPDNRTNYMDYTLPFYQSSFTQGQAQRMQATLQFGYQRNFYFPADDGLFDAIRESLMVQTGTGRYGAVRADFAMEGCTALPCIVCPGQTLHLKSYAIGAPDSFRWEIRQGSSVVASANGGPCAVMTAPNAPGTYSIRLYVENAGAAGDTVYSGILIVRNAAQAASFPFSEGFEGSTFPPAGWTLVNPDAPRAFPAWVPPTVINQLPPPTLTWQRYSAAGRGSFGVSNGGIRIFNWNSIERAQRDYLITPQIDIPASTQNPTLEFDVFYRAFYWEDLRDSVKSYGYLYGDTLAVSISEDCGVTWERLYYKGGEALDVTGQAVRAINVDPYQNPLQYTSTPPAGANSAWRHEVIPIPARYRGKKVLIRFENISEMGNDLYLDSIQVREAQITALGSVLRPELSFYPNPALDEVILSVQGAGGRAVRYQIYSLQGTELLGGAFLPSADHEEYRLRVAALAAGLYLLRVEASDSVQYWRFVKE